MSEAARVRKGEEPGSAAATASSGSGRRRIQPKLRISSPADSAEREAERVSDAVMVMPEPGARVAATSAHAAQRTTLIAARAPAAAAAAREAASGAVEARVRAAATGGAPLAPRTRAFLEPRFRADFSGVRIHTGPAAASLATAIGARAFTFGRHIFFNDGQYRPETRDGMALLAHELTHTIQQSEVIQRQADERPVRVSERTAQVSERTPPQASRLGLSDALDYFADAANAIPGYRMFTILIGVNPINMSPVEASAANILRAIVEFLPGGNLITRVLDSYGIFDRVGAWIEGQLRSLGISGSSIKAAIDRFFDSLSWSDIFDLGGVWRRARSIFTDPITRIIAFARNLFGEIARMVREAVLRPLAALAEGTRGYPLLKAVLGEDPVTGEPFPRTAETVIGGFLTLIGQEELWQNIQRANAISRAWNWFQTAISSLVSLVRSIPERFMAALRSLEVIDFIVLPRAFATLAATFGGFLADFGRWALGTVFDLLKIIVEVVAPGVMPYIQKAAGAFQTIVRNPVRFVQTLVRAAIQGFRQFASNFLTHLRASLVGWLTGAMAGANIYIPQGFSLREILKFVLSVLGLTWANIRGKLVRATSESVVAALEAGFDIVRTLVTEGPAAAWQKIVETLTNLRDMVIEQVMEFVRSRVVQAAVTRLLSMLSPAGALIQAVIAIYNTVMFFVERLRQIAQVAASFIDSLATIASGNIGPAANRVEQTMAGLLTLVISFLARIAGLGRVADAVTNVINRVRAPIDRALDRVVNWIVEQARRVGRFILRAGTPADPASRLRLATRDARTIAERLSGRISRPALETAFAIVRTRYALTGLQAFERGGGWWVRASINPSAEGPVIEATRLGRILEPILARVEREWMAEVDRNLTPVQRQRRDSARAAVRSGGTRGQVVLPRGLPRETEIQIYRDIADGTLPVGNAPGRTMRAAVRISGGNYATGGTYVNVPTNMGRNYISGAGAYEEGARSIPAHVRTVEADVTRRRILQLRTEAGLPEQGPLTAEQDRQVSGRLGAEVLGGLSDTRRRLTETLETARSPGMLVTRQMTEGMVGAGLATPAEATHGNLNPMAFVGASGDQMNDADNRTERHRRLGQTFARLRQAANDATMAAAPGGPALQQLAQALNTWLTAHRDRVTRNPNAAQLDAANRAFVDAFLAFLRQQRG